MDEAAVEVVEVFDLIRDPCIAACSALKLFSQRELELHLRTIEFNDTAALAVDTHLSDQCEIVQRSAEPCTRHIAYAICNVIFDHISVPRPAAISRNLQVRFLLFLHHGKVRMSNINPTLPFLESLIFGPKYWIDWIQFIQLTLYINKIRF